MSTTLVLTMALAGGHGCPSHSGYSGWYAPGHTTYYAPRHSTYYHPARTTYYHSQPPTCAGGYRGATYGQGGQTYRHHAGGYGDQYAPGGQYRSEGYDRGRAPAGQGYEGAAPPPPDVPGARDGREARGPSRPGTRDRRGERPAAVIEMTNEARFQPERVTIAVGETVEWRNTSDHLHTVTADPQLARDRDNVMLPEGAQPFHSGEIQRGDTFTHTFDRPGHYRYVCLPHENRGMIGEIEVREQNGERGRGAGRAPSRPADAPQQPREGGGARY